MVNSLLPIPPVVWIALLALLAPWVSVASARVALNPTCNEPSASPVLLASRGPWAFATAAMLGRNPTRRRPCVCHVLRGELGSTGRAKCARWAKCKVLIDPSAFFAPRVRSPPKRAVRLAQTARCPMRTGRSAYNVRQGLLEPLAGALYAPRWDGMMGQTRLLQFDQLDQRTSVFC